MAGPRPRSNRGMIARRQQDTVAANTMRTCSYVAALLISCLMGHTIATCENPDGCTVAYQVTTAAGTTTTDQPYEANNQMEITWDAAQFGGASTRLRIRLVHRVEDRVEDNSCDNNIG